MNSFVFYILNDLLSESALMEKMIIAYFPNAIVKRFSDAKSFLYDMENEVMSPISLVDFQLSGIGGVSLLKKIKSIEKFRNSIFIMILDSYDKENYIKALQTGADDVLIKPIVPEQLFVKLKNSIRLNQQFEANATLNQQLLLAKEQYDIEVSNAYKMLRQILSMKLPTKDSELTRIHDACKYIALQVIDENEEIENLLLATQFCYLGKLPLNDKIILNPVMIEGVVQNEAMLQYPENVQAVMKFMPNSEEIQSLLYHIYENFDGTGIPKKLKSWEIPLGSRILRVAIDFEYLNTKNSGRESKVIDIMFEQINRLYDFRVLAFYDQYLAYKNSRPGLSGKALEESIAPSGLREDMFLSRNIITSSGLKLLSSGTRLTDANIERIQSILTADSIIGKIWIKVF
jgi:response regulator RpfG family c-di-GMP phosphodiesterase